MQHSIELGSVCDGVLPNRQEQRQQLWLGGKYVPEVSVLYLKYWWKLIASNNLIKHY